MIVTKVGILRVNDSDFLRKPIMKNGIRIPFSDRYSTSKS
jgi:hypothetical protein